MLSWALNKTSPRRWLSCYASFHSATSAQAAALSEFKDSLIKTEKGNDILPVGVIYGPNGGGKSNLLAALGCVISLVTEPVYELGKNHARFIMQQKVSCVPYLFDEDSREEPSRFQLFFRIGEYEYRYYIVLQGGVIEEETLYRRKLGASRAAKIFERNHERKHSIAASSGPAGQRRSLKEIMKESPLELFSGVRTSTPK